MRLQYVVCLTVSVLVGSVVTTARASSTLVPFDEPTTQIVPPSSAISSFNYNNGVATVVTSTLILCANTSAASTGSQFSPQFYSDYAKNNGGLSPKPFVFGASSAAPTISPVVSGMDTMMYNFSGSTGLTTLEVGTGSSVDLTPTLVCYGLDANGAHKLTRGLFVSGFEDPATAAPIGNSTISLKVFHVPANSTDYYGYTIDVTIPALPINADCSPSTGLDCNFALVEGYDTSVFDPASGQWCLAPSGAQSCSIPAPTGGSNPVFGDININYLNYASNSANNISLGAPISPEAAKTYHFVVFRYLRSGVSALPNSTQPLVAAALFSPLDLDENKLDDNVGVGKNQLTN